MKKKMKKLTVNRETIQAMDRISGALPPGTFYRCESMKETCGEVTCIFGYCYTNTCPDACISTTPGPGF